MSSVTITLKYVDEAIKPPLKELVMRRPKVRDQIAAGKASKDAAVQECTLFATLCEVDVAAIENLDMADYLAVQEAYSKMTGGNA